MFQYCLTLTFQYLVRLPNDNRELSICTMDGICDGKTSNVASSRASSTRRFVRSFCMLYNWEDRRIGQIWSVLTWMKLTFQPSKNHPSCKSKALINLNPVPVPWMDLKWMCTDGLLFSIRLTTSKESGQVCNSTDASQPSLFVNLLGYFDTQKTESNFVENQPMHRKRNFLKSHHLWWKFRNAFI